jgi:hypothetical protein
MYARKQYLQRIVAAVVLVSLLLMPAMTASAGNPNPTVLSPDAHPYGITYSEWGARWWQWLLQQGAVNPNSDPTGALCGSGQTGPVWFLAGASYGGSFTRYCNVPAGKAVFFPVANFSYFTFTWDPTDTAEVAHAVAKIYMDMFADISAEVDDVPLQNLEAYRVQSPKDQTALFDVTLSEDSWFRLQFDPPLPATVYPTATDGVYLMLAPLSHGEHTIHFHAQFPGSDPLDVTYNLTVK